MEKLDISADTLSLLKDRSRDSRKELFRDGVQVSEAQHKDRVSLVRSAHHLQVAASVRALGQDVARASRLGKAKVAAIQALA